MNFKEKLAKILQKLGLQERASRKELTPEDAEMIAKSWKEEYGSDFAADSAAWKKTEAEAAAYREILAVINGMTEEEIPGADHGTEDDGDNGAGNAGEEEEVAPVAGARRVISAINSLNRQVRDLAAKAQPDRPEATVTHEVKVFGRAHTASHIFGIEHPMFAMDRRWNRITRYGRQLEDPSAEDRNAFMEEFQKYSRSLSKRYAELYQMGVITPGKLGEVDYSSLKDAGLGEQFLVRRQDALIARILMIPTLDDIFPRRSNIQDGEVLTNVFFGEFSQAYQAGELSKGSVDFKPELAKVHDAMFKYLFESLKWIETQYIGYLNTSGSDPVKWNMIEWLVLNIATKLQQERNYRVVNGYRIEPVKGEIAHANFAAFGVIHRLYSYVEGRKVLPFTEDDVNDYTSANIGDVFEEMTSKVAAVLDNIQDFALYANKNHEPWFKAWYNTKYGGNADYTGVQNKVPNYDVRIIWVPNMGQSKLMWITLPGNILQLENVPGEMTSIRFEQRLESVWAYSVWKEGVGAAFAGKQMADDEAFETSDRKDQLIFMNRPADKLAADATTADAAKGPVFRTSAANTKATALTDITGAKTGVVYIIESGGGSHATTVAKSGKFDGLTAAWTPTAAGDYLKVYWNGEKFVEASRKVTA
jgi:hypothetical protein